nr:hypothetical protein [Kibdelosporangium sp. MJ126-NF4]CTQ90721.1 hypothetical protein [Kibdelosporangium sp. MJ126-NF4]
MRRPLSRVVVAHGRCLPVCVYMFLSVHSLPRVSISCSFEGYCAHKRTKTTMKGHRCTSRSPRLPACRLGRASSSRAGSPGVPPAPTRVTRPRPGHPRRRSRRAASASTGRCRSPASRARDLS